MPEQGSGIARLRAFGAALVLGFVVWPLRGHGSGLSPGSLIFDVLKKFRIYQVAMATVSTTRNRKCLRTYVGTVEVPHPEGAGLSLRRALGGG